MKRLFAFCFLLITFFQTTAFSSTVLDFFKDTKDNLSIPVITYHLIESDFKYILPLMQQYNIKFNFFIVGGFINTPRYLTSSQIIQMSANNLVEFGNHSNLLHGLNSKKLSEMYRNSSNNEFILNDFMSDNDILTRLTKKKPLFSFLSLW